MGSRYDAPTELEETTECGSIKISLLAELNQGNEATY